MYNLDSEGMALILNAHAVARFGGVAGRAALVSRRDLDGGVTRAAQMTCEHALHVRQHRVVRALRHAHVCGGQELQRERAASDKRAERHSERSTVERSGGTIGCRDAHSLVGAPHLARR